MRATDQMLAKLTSEIEAQQAFQDKLIEDAERENRDLDENDMKLFTRSRDELARLNSQLGPLKESRRISSESQAMVADLARFMGDDKAQAKQQEVEYRSAGAYVIDRWRAGLGMQDATNRLDVYHRAAAHQKTSDNAGLIPTPILGPVINFIDSNRPLVSQLGPRQLPGQTWSRPKVTQHTSVGLQPSAGGQADEKAELVSQKMLITKLTASAVTYGGYVNVSRQDVDFSSPGIMDIIISDLAAQYAIQTEAAAFTTFDAAATAGVAIATGAATSAGVMTSLWDAVSKIYTASKGAGRVFAICGPDMLPILGPVFPPYNAQNAVSPGLMAGDFGTGLIGSISGIPLYVSAG
jgi:HK97 family phage major capsid protein